MATAPVAPARSSALGSQHLDFLSQGWAHLHLAAEDPGRVAGWDAVVLTAASPQQAELYEVQVAAVRRLGYLAPQTLTLVVPDPQGRRIGSGGATLHALRALAEARPGADLARLRVLLIHAGGDSRRVPWANILGKPFIPLPLLADPDRAVPTLFDHLLAIAAPVAARLAGGGLLTLTGDVLPLFPSAKLALPEHGGLVVTTPVSLDVAERHGVIVADSTGRVTKLLQKVPALKLAELGALAGGGAALLDTGIYAFSGRAFEALAGLARAEPDPVAELLADGREISLYEEVAAALVPGNHEWLRSRPLGMRLGQALSSQTLTQARFDELAFVHLGSTAEVLAQLHRFWHGRLSRRILAEYGAAVSETAFLYHSRLAAGVRVGGGSLVYGCQLGDGTSIGNRCVVVGVDDADEPVRLPDHSCLWQVPLRESPDGTPALVTVCCGVDDNPKETLGQATFCNRGLDVWLAEHGVRATDVWTPGEERTLWNARLFPAQPAPAGPHMTAWVLGRGQTGTHVRDEWLRAPRHSLGSLHAVADAAGWRRRHAALTAGLLMRALRETVDGTLDRNADALAGQLDTPALRARAAALGERLPEPGPCAGAPASRLLQLRADLLQAGGYEAEASATAAQAFAAVQKEVARALAPHAPEPVSGLPLGRAVKVELPVRFDVAGGWSDTPPYCLERPARVLNFALSLGSERPIGAAIEALGEPRWELELADQHARVALWTPEQLAAPASLQDPFTLLRTALLLTGYGSAQGVSQGVRVRTWSHVPKGSGLGASSILGAALIQALQRLAGRPADVNTVSALVLTLEQRLTTGGGWQDQIGGLVPGVKCISSVPVTPLRLTVEPVPLLPAVVTELEQRLVIAFTGQARLAKNVLQIVVGRYLRREGRVLEVLDRLVELAGEGRQALALGDFEALGRVMSEVWQLHQHLDPHCSNPALDALFGEVEDWASGAKLAGAGGGGFIGILAKDAEAAGRIRARLPALGREVRVYDWALANE